MSLTSKEHPDLGADLMELLWFRTGGAKLTSESCERVIWEIALRAAMSGSADTQAGVGRIPLVVVRPDLLRDMEQYHQPGKSFPNACRTVSLLFLLGILKVSVD